MQHNTLQGSSSWDRTGWLLFTLNLVIPGIFLILFASTFLGALKTHSAGGDPINEIFNYYTHLSNATTISIGIGIFLGIAAHLGTLIWGLMDVSRLHSHWVWGALFVVGFFGFCSYAWLILLLYLLIGRRKNDLSNIKK